MTEFEKADKDNNGVITQDEWEKLELEDRKRRLDDEDAHRDQTRKMAWFSLWGMLLYPLGVVLTGYLGLEQASSIIGSMASIYFVSVAGVVSVFMGVSQLAKKDKK
jgi:small-conductance mechanosensitive channel